MLAWRETAFALPASWNWTPDRQRTGVQGVCSVLCPKQPLDVPMPPLLSGTYWPGTLASAIGIAMCYMPVPVGDAG